MIAEWWATTEYAEGALDLPGQSVLSTPSRKVLEDIASVADAGKLEIPPMPKAAMDAVKLLRAAEVEVDDIVKCIEVDPGLSLQVLRHANSALYGCRHPIDNLRRAVMHVGMRRLKTLILEVAMHRTTSDIRAKEWSTMEWRYSLHCANISRAIAKRFGIDQDLGYLAGLLHDIGRIPVMRALDQRGALKESPKRDSEADVIIECLHRGVGRDVAKAWELPPAVADAITAHLNGRRDDEDSLAQFPSTKAAEAASDLCHALGLGRHRRGFAVMRARSLRDVGFDDSSMPDFFRAELPVAIEQVSGLV